ncbi:hypothetical protein HanIR_Chr06g0279541 [Helianthus annuus]|nr:hypothetical protein HanIR_Chr06g0279541 [Helianthus annuus]
MVVFGDVRYDFEWWYLDNTLCFLMSCLVLTSTVLPLISHPLFYHSQYDNFLPPFSLAAQISGIHVTLDLILMSYLRSQVLLGVNLDYDFCFKLSFKYNIYTLKNSKP